VSVVAYTSPEPLVSNAEATNLCKSQQRIMAATALSGHQNVLPRLAVGGHRLAAQRTVQSTDRELARGKRMEGLTYSWHHRN
jgi:hypothetical protein